MKLPQLIISILFLFSLFSCNAQIKNKELRENLAKAEQELTLHPNDQKVWQQLYSLMSENYIMFTAADRTRIRTVLEKRGSWPVVTLYTTNEPGTKIIIKGYVVNEKGLPVVNASLHIFQTDSRGYYTPLDSITQKMSEPDARLYGFLKTDSQGYFEIRTVRTASYPKQYEGKTIPQHVHINVSAPGYTNRSMQMVFDDDPAMNTYWHDWAVKANYPILVLNHATPQRTGTLEILITHQH